MGIFSFKSIGLSLILVIIAGVVGFFIGRYQTNLVSTTSNTPQQLQSTIFKSQAAYFQGEIEVSGNNLTLKGDGGLQATFPISTTVVTHSPNRDKQTTASSTTKLIQSSKNALVTLELINNQYQVSVISYLQPTK